MLGWSEWVTIKPFHWLICYNFIFDFKGEFLCADDLCVWYLEWFVEYWMKNVWVCWIYMYRCRKYLTEELLTCIYLPFFSTKKYACHLCIIDVYYRLYNYHYVSIFYAVKFVIVRKELKKHAGSIFHCKGLHSIQTIVCFHLFWPHGFFSFIGMVS